MRCLCVSNRVSPDAVEYPETGQLSVMAFAHSQHGRPLWDMPRGQAARTGIGRRHMNKA